MLIKFCNNNKQNLCICRLKLAFHGIIIFFFTQRVNYNMFCFPGNNTREIYLYEKAYNKDSSIFDECIL